MGVPQGSILSVTLFSLHINSLEVLKSSSDVLNSSYTYLLCHPEDILKKEICDLLCTDSWQKEITHIFIDDAHCVVQWGHEFRPDYMRIQSVFPESKFVAFTATATKLLIRKITDILLMKTFTTISACVDRPNVKIIIIKRLPSAGGKNTAEESFKQVMEPLLRSLCDDADNFPKTIVHSKLKWCGNGYNMVTLEICLAERQKCVTYMNAILSSPVQVPDIESLSQKMTYAEELENSKQKQETLMRRQVKETGTLGRSEQELYQKGLQKQYLTGSTCKQCNINTTDL
ncbi:uncharacterized protein LOC134718419 [Mytilus trossulus]|uniref:uncharacterized protein LOC134718419 n=1 Tax=Mytilus trossulus TaxID=6551 RepID=UPI003005CE1E